MRVFKLTGASQLDLMLQMQLILVGLSEMISLGKIARQKFKRLSKSGHDSAYNLNL